MLVRGYMEIAKFLALTLRVESPNSRTCLVISEDWVQSYGSRKEEGVPAWNIRE